MTFLRNKFIFPVIFTFAFFVNSIAQNNVGINTQTPDSTAILHLESTTQGFLPPRMTTVQRDSIFNPAQGLVIFNVSDSALEIFDGVCWKASYQVHCDDCFIKVVSSSNADTIDRVLTDSVQITLQITQIAGSPQNIALSIPTILPAGLSYNFVTNPTFSSSTVTLTFKVTPFTQDGTFPIVIQALCGPNVINIIYSLTILPCYKLFVTNSTSNYNVADDFYNTYPSVPQTQAVCVVCDIGSGVTVISDTTIEPAVTTGVFPAGSVLAIVNNGNVLGKGGNGGTGTSTTSTPPQTGAGGNGGNAMELQLNTTVVNNFNIWGGGGGGNAMAYEISYTFPPPANNITLGIFIGAGGGGGAGNGTGGGPPSGVIGLYFYTPGSNGTGGILGLGGDGGILNYPIPITIGSLQITLNPNVHGGDGGDYGYPGTQGYFNLTISATILLNFPIIGTIPIPVISNVNIPIPVTPPAAGNAGYAIKRNNFTTNVPDNIYQTSFLKGQVGP